MLNGEVTKNGNYRLKNTSQILAIGDTSPIPDNIEVTKKYPYEPFGIFNPFMLVLKRIEPEKPEETQEELLWYLISYYEGIKHPGGGTVKDVLDRFTIQRKKI